MGSADKSKDLYDLFEQDGVSLSNWTNKSRKHIADLAEAVLRKLQEKKIKPTDVYGSKFKNYKKKFNKK